MKCKRCDESNGVVDGLCLTHRLRAELRELEGVKMKIAVFLAKSPWGSLDDSAMNKGLGGRETALVNLALEWAADGHDVYAFVPRSQVDIIEHESGGMVRWIPNSAVIEITEAVQPDLFVSWENAEVLAELRNFNGITAIEMQVAHLHSSVPVADVADYVCVLSDWARDFFLTQHEIPANRVLVFPNGIQGRRFQNIVPDDDLIPPGTEDGYHFIYSSSPDRGLHHLLMMWDTLSNLIRHETGVDSYLHVCYGIENFIKNSRWSHREDALRALTIEELIYQNNIIYHGKIGQDKLASLMADCDLMLYPADTMSPTETGCISIVEALAAGTPVVTTNCDCIGPDFKEVTQQVPLPLSYSEYMGAVLDALDPEDYEARVEAGKEFAEGRDWGKIAAQWTNFFSTLKTGEAIA